MSTHDNTPQDDTLADEVFVEHGETTGADSGAGEPAATGEPGTDATQALPTTSSGAGSGSGSGGGSTASSATVPASGTAVATGAPATTGAPASDAATPGTAPAAQPEQAWLRGPAPFAIVLGLLGLFVAGAVLLAELTDLSMPWNDLGPWTVVAAGVVVVLVGAIGLRSSRRAQD